MPRHHRHEVQLAEIESRVIHMDELESQLRDKQKQLDNIMKERNQEDSVYSLVAQESKMRIRAEESNELLRREHNSAVRSLKKRVDELTSV